jgi:hypothetical protein
MSEQIKNLFEHRLKIVELNVRRKKNIGGHQSVVLEIVNVEVHFESLTSHRN